MKTTKTLWKFPWLYCESFVISIAFFVIGFIIQIISNTYCPLPSFPKNIIILALYISLLFLFFIKGRKNPFLLWLMSIPAAISSISLFGLLSLFMGLIPQYPQAIPSDVFHNISNSWPYFFSFLYITTVLGMISIKRLFSFSFKNIGFLLNHWGLWLVLIGGSFGAGDMQRLKMETQLGKTEWLAINEFGQNVEPNIAIELQSFNIDFFDPALVLFDTLNKKNIKTKKPIYLNSKTKNEKISDYQIQILKFIPEAMIMDTSFMPFMGTGSVPAAYISVSKNDFKKEGWINPQNRLIKGNKIDLDNGLALVLEPPQPKRYVSHIKVYSPSGSIIEDSVQVNSPLYVDGWNLYQVSYNEDMGRWSETSIIELNKDPWLPVVYIGIFMLILGSFHLLFRGAKRKVNSL